MKTKRNILFTAICAATLVSPLLSRADTSFTIGNTTADTFLSGTSPGLNFGNAGTLAIAPAASPKGEFDSIIKFNFASAVSQFNSTYGVGGWQITSFTLKLASNFGTNGATPNNTLFSSINGGNFGIDWLAGDSWVEGGGGGTGTGGFPTNSNTSFNSIASLYSAGSSSLGTFIYTPPGNNVYTNYSLPLNASLVADAAAGGDVSLYFYAADSQISYLFNSRTGGSNPSPQLVVTAVPEPGSVALMSMALVGLLLSHRQKK